MKRYKSKLILPSHRHGLYYLEHCRVKSQDDRLVYARKQGAFTQFIAIPQKNTSVILLGSGTSITQKAAQKLADEGVLLAFTSGQGTPLYLASQSEYRPTEHMQNWASFWFDPQFRLQVAKHFQRARLDYVRKKWQQYDLQVPDAACSSFHMDIDRCPTTQDLLLAEGRYTKELYKALASHFSCQNFTRQPGGDNGDLFNDFLDHGNYLAYGLAATALWVLGISFAFPVFHGKTRRGALVFDVADIIKDAIIMPTAFEAANLGMAHQPFRELCIDRFRKDKSLRYLLTFLKGTSSHFKKNNTYNECPANQ